MLYNLKENLLNFLQPLQEKIQDSEWFQKLIQMYNDLSARNQKITLGLLCILVVFILSLPSISFFSSSRKNLEAFSENYHLIQKLFELQSLATLSFRQSMSFSFFKTKVERVFKRYSIADEQVIFINLEQTSSPSKKTTPSQSMFEKELISISLKTLTLKQAIQAASDLEKIGPLVRLDGMEIKKSREEQGYVDVKYRVESYQIKESPKLLKKKASKRKKKEDSKRGDSR